jgi:ABC-type Na+ efflux pump permease subunit
MCDCTITVIRLAGAEERSEGQRGETMQTIYDWVALIIFAGLIPLFLQRSAQDNPPDKLWHYLPPTIGCAVANYLGNNGQGAIAIAILVAVLIYIFKVLKPSLKG